MVRPRPDYAVLQRRHPRLVRVSGLLRRHRTLVITAAALGMLAILVADVRMVDRLWGFYFIPLTLLAVATREKVVAWAVLVTMALNAATMLIDQLMEMQRLLSLLYQALAGAGLVILAYLVERLTALSGYASTRAQLAEASADIVRRVDAHRPRDLRTMPRPHGGAGRATAGTCS